MIHSRHISAFDPRFSLFASRAAMQCLLRDRFRDREREALDHNDKLALDELERFHKDVGTFMRQYDFLSQIVNYDDTSLDKLSIYLRHLAPVITSDQLNHEIELSTVDFDYIAQQQETGSGKLSAAVAHLRDVLGDQTYESLARKGEIMTTAELVTYAYDQIDSPTGARAELNAVSFRRYVTDRLRSGGHRDRGCRSGIRLGARPDRSESAHLGRSIPAAGRRCRPRGC